VVSGDSSKMTSVISVNPVHILFMSSCHTVFYVVVVSISAGGTITRVIQ
jgi:hypothetical protein